MRPIKFSCITFGTAALLTVVSSSVAVAQIIVPYGYRYAPRDASVRFDVKPNDASVYVDGYYAGTVDDFDGAFQRLRTAPGGHEITVFLEGYRTHSERVYLSPDTTFKFRHRMEKLAAGETSARPPAPPPQPQQVDGQGSERPGEPPRAPIGPGPRRFPPNYPPPPEQGGFEPGPPARTNDRRGTLALTVEPADADVLVDGSPWRGTSQEQRLMIELPEGRHNVQIRKSGFIGYLTDVQIRRGETTTLDVQLKTQPR